MSILSPSALARDLAVADLTCTTDPPARPHAIALVASSVVAALVSSWGCEHRTIRHHPIVSTDDNYDRLGFPADAVSRDARYSRYVSETCLLRTHTSAMVPSALRALAGEGARRPGDVLLACPGLVYRRDAIDRLHTGTPHQLDLWRITDARLTVDDLEAMIAVVVAAALPGARHRTVPAEHPYTEHGRQIDVRSPDGGEWIEIGECGMAGPSVLRDAGLPVGVTGLAMGIGLDRLVMVRKGIPDIRLLRSTDPRVVAQLHDLEPYRAASSHPPISRDVSVAVADGTTDEELGDRVREALGDDASSVETIAVLGRTPGAALPAAAVDRLGLRAGQENVLVRVVLRHVDRTLTDPEANRLRDRVYDALHEGTAPLANGDG